MDLAIVMPVYNEEACIARVVRSWLEMLDALEIDYRMLVLNDGSKDGTAAELAQFRDDRRVELIDKTNSGHGPTILMGYQQAVKLADWVFQCDSDDELKPDAFPEFWNARDRYDALFGVRSGRRQSAGRRIISACSRGTVRLLFGRKVVDVNVPYRLMRAELLKRILPQIPADTFAPNLMIAGAFARSRARTVNLPVAHEGRKTGAASLLKWKLWRAAIRAFGQTVACRPVLLDVDQRS